MEFPNCTNIILGRLQKLEPENSIKIVGYLLLHHTQEEMIEIALGPDKLLHALINEAKTYLALSAKPNASNTMQPHLDGSVSLQYPPISPVISRSLSSLSSFRVPSPGPFWDTHLAPEQPSSPNLNLAHHVFSDFPGDDLRYGLEEQLNPGNRLSAEYPSNYVYQSSPRGGLRLLPSLLDYPSKACHYYHKGYYRHGINSGYLHPEAISDNFSQFCGFDMNELANEDHIFAPGSLEKLEMEIRELLKSRKGMPVSIATLPMLYQEKYGKPLQADGYLSESQRHGKTGYSLTKLLARLRSICLMDRPHGQHSVVLLEDATKYMDSRTDLLQAAASSCQIYLTFPSDSAFTEEDVLKYFDQFGPVRDVRIPRQEKRMFGFVSFFYPETVRLILSKGHPHFVCGSRVLVKPYKEKPKTNERKHVEKMEHLIYHPSLAFETNPEYTTSLRLYDNPRFPTKLPTEANQNAIDLEARLQELQLNPSTLTQHTIFSPEENFSFLHVVGDGFTSDDKTKQTGANLNDEDSDQIELPDSPFASSL